MASGAAAGFVAGALGGLLNGASLGQSLRMGLKGAVFGAIGAGVANVIGSAWGASTSLGAKAGRAILHGLSRAAISRAQGGKWNAGFWSGFAGSALAPFAGRNTAAAAIVGGTASVVGGGKFANGAVSAAFVHMYNYQAHLPEWAPPKSTESTELIPRILNNSVRFVLSAVDVVSEAFIGAASGLHQIMTIDASRVPGGLIGEGLFGALTSKIGAGSGSAVGYEIVPSEISFWTRSYAYTNPLTYDTTFTFFNGEMYSLENNKN